MGYDLYTVPDTVAVEPTFVVFLQHSQTYVRGLSCHSFKFFEEQWTQNQPQYLSGLLRELFPTTFLGTAEFQSYKRPLFFLISALKSGM